MSRFEIYHFPVGNLHEKRRTHLLRKCFVFGDVEVFNKFQLSIKKELRSLSVGELVSRPDLSQSRNREAVFCN